MSSLRIGPLTTAIVANELVLLDRAVKPRRERENHREVLGAGTSHDGVDGDFLYREFPELAERSRTEPADDFVRRMARALEHGIHAGFGRQDDRQEIGPVVVLEQPLQAIIRIRFEKPRRCPLECHTLQIRFIERYGEAVDHSLHEWPFRHRIGAVDVCTQVGGRTIDDRLRHVGLPQAGDAHGERCGIAQPREDVRVHGDGRNTIQLQRHREPDDRRAAGASKTDAEDRGVAICRDAGAHRLVVGPGLARPDRADFHGG